MSTGIRPNSRRPSRLQNAINVRSAPSIQNRVVNKTPVTYHNPMAGAGAVGNQIATRMGEMSQNIANFWNIGTQLGKGIAEMETRSALVEIEKENLAQRREALVDEAKNPGGDITKYPYDSDYIETRLKVRANLKAGEDVNSFVNDVLPNIGLVDDNNQPVNPVDVLTATINDNTKGMNETYASFYTENFLKGAEPHIDRYLTKRHKTQKQLAQGEFSNLITSQVVDLGANSINRQSIDTWVSQARSLYDMNEYSDGQVKSIVIKTALTALKQKDPPDPEGVMSFLTQLEKNPALGDGTTSFAQLFPAEFEDISKAINTVQNESWIAKENTASEIISDTSLALNNPQTPHSEKLKTIESFFGWVNKPSISQLIASGSTEFKGRMKGLFKEINTFVGSTAAIDSTRKYLRHNSPRPISKDITKAASHYATIISSGNTSPDDMVDAGMLMAKAPSESKEIGKSIADLVTDKRVSMIAHTEDQPNPHLLSATQAYSIVATARTEGISEAQLKKSLGDVAYHHIDRITDLVHGNEGNLHDSIIQTNEDLNSKQMANHFATVSDADTESILREAYKTTNDPSIGLPQAIKAALDIDAEIDPAVVEAFVTDMRRNLIGVDLADPDSIKAVADKTAEAFKLQYVPIENAGRKILIDPRRLSEKQRFHLTDEQTIKGKTRRGLDEFAKNLDNASQNMGWLETMTDGNARIVNPTNSSSKLAGSMPVGGEDHQMLIISMNEPYTTKDGQQVNAFRVPWTFKPGTLEVALQTKEVKNLELIVVPDSAVSHGSEEAASGDRVLKEGGVIGWTAFKDHFDRTAGKHGFQLQERVAGGQKTYTVEYVGNIPSETDIVAINEAEILRLEKEFQMQPTLVDKLSGIKPGSQEAQAIQKAAKRSYKNKQDWIWKNYPAWEFEWVLPSGDYKKYADMDASDPDAPWNPDAIKTGTIDENTPIDQLIPLVMPDAMNNKIQDQVVRKAHNAREKNHQAKNFEQLLINITGQSIDNGQISPSEGVTVNSLDVPVLNAEDVYGASQNLIRKNEKNGIPNEGLDTHQDDAYVQERNDLIRSHEGFEPYAYEDTRGNPTVGIGFSLTDPSVKKLVTKMLGPKGYAQLIKDSSKKYDADKEIKLTAPQIEEIYGQLILEKEGHVSTWYKGIPLSPSQRAVIVDLAYIGGGGLVGPSTEFFNAVKAGDWQRATYEVRERSNKHGNKGVQNRMEDNAAILSNVTPTKGDGWTLFSSAHAGNFNAVFSQEFLNSPLPSSENESVWKWFQDSLEDISDSVDEALPVVQERLIEFGVYSASNIADIVTPNTASQFLVTDMVLKNYMGIPMENMVYTEKELGRRNTDVLKTLARKALAAGRNNITWDDYGDDINGVPMKAVVGYQDGRELAEEAYPRTLMGAFKLAGATIVDPILDVGLTIGQATITIDDDGNYIITDVYDAEKFKNTAAGNSAYTDTRNWVQNNGITLEKGESKPLQWRINLGKNL